jgi:indole-3-glycerol phosphate synthase
MSILHEIVKAKKKELAESPPKDVRSRAKGAPEPRSFREAIGSAGSISLIAEIKRASPVKGPFAPGLDAAGTARTYEEAGASAISVLTNRHFQGSNEDLEAARRVVGVPLLRKEFIIDPVQIWEARAIGADAILLLAQVLDRVQLREFREMASELGMASLVEVFDAKELAKALATGPEIVGINNRNLETFEVDLGRSVKMREEVPRDLVFVSESGIATRRDVERLEEVGVDAMLIGEEIVKADDRGAKIKELLGGR